MAAGYYAVCGLFEAVEQYQIYLVPVGNPGELIEDFEVSTHAAFYASDTPKSVRAEVEAVHAYSPILPFFADAAGFKFSFQNPITPELLDFLEQNVTAGMEAMMEGDDGSIRPFIAREKYVHLWWD